MSRTDFVGLTSLAFLLASFATMVLLMTPRVPPGAMPIEDLPLNPGQERTDQDTT